MGVAKDYRGAPRSISTRGGAVAADHGRCADVGAAALDAGGNAADAAVATALCQGVHNPMASVRDGEEEGGLERESFIFFFFSSFLLPTHPPTPSSLHRA